MGQEGSVEINLGQLGVNKVLIRVNSNYAIQVKGQLGYVLLGQEGSVWINKVKSRVSCIHVGSGGI